MIAESLFSKAANVIRAPHKKVAPWPTVKQGNVRIDEAIISRNGYRPQRFQSDSQPLPKRTSLTFKAKTDVPAPYEVYWQVVNTGPEAEAVAGGLRGGFDAGSVDKGTAIRKESTLYVGTHTIECFIVKNGYLVARSGAFIVNIV
ncbi:MAG: hypothetical protein K0M39_12730 [Rhizobium sp.]|nr:hypothetical protein [Rhizobium sp.]